MKGRVLTIAGSDPSGGAGIQADIKAVTALGGYAASAVTALTVQNTTGVSRVDPVSADLLRAQIDAVLSDIGADAVKIGLLPNMAAVEVVASALRHLDVPIVLDPVLVATSGDALTLSDITACLKEKLIPLSFVVTPNTDEAAALTGLNVKSARDLTLAGRALLAQGCGAALVKGGHLSGQHVVNSLVTPTGEHVLERVRIETAATHGTGCTLAAALATGLAQGLSLLAAAMRATDYVHAAISDAPGFGAGAGPLNHAIFDF